VPEYDLVTGENFATANRGQRLEQGDHLAICVFNIQKLLVGKEGTFLLRAPSEDLGAPAGCAQKAERSSRGRRW
jgi:hypothetical protein